MTDWTELTELHQRVRWARMQAGFDKPTDAARSLNIRPGTYRTYEHAPADGGREAPLSELQRIARKFKVNWVWLAAGEGSPQGAPFDDERLRHIADRAARVPEGKREDALDAALGVLDSFIRKAG